MARNIETDLSLRSGKDEYKFMDRITVLLAHGEASVRDDLQPRLEHAGYSVHLAENGVRTRELFQKQAPDVVLMALHLPDASGQALMKEFKSQKSDVPIILIVNPQELEEAISGLSLGVYDLASIPIHFEWLDHIMRNALEVRQLKRLGRITVEPKLAHEGMSAGILAALAHGFPETGVSLTAIERQLLAEALRAANGNKTRAARLLGITRDTLRYKVKKYHLVAASAPPPRALDLVG